MQMRNCSTCKFRSSEGSSPQGMHHHRVSCGSVHPNNLQNTLSCMGSTYYVYVYMYVNIIMKLCIDKQGVYIFLYIIYIQHGIILPIHILHMCINKITIQYRMLQLWHPFRTYFFAPFTEIPFKNLALPRPFPPGKSSSRPGSKTLHKGLKSSSFM